jgi:ferric-dicitrate binding protein FerR (iron transport regulator)
MSDDLDWRLLDRHLAGEDSSDDQVALRRWLAADPAREAALRALASVVRPSDDADWDTCRAWSRFSTRLNEPRLSLYLDRRSSTSRRERVWYAAAAGALATGVLVAIAWWLAALAEVH